MNEQPQRKTAKPFEPPPWEREQFDELARRREEQQAEDELDQAVASLADAGPGGEARRQPEQPVGEPGPSSAVANAEVDEGQKGDSLDDRAVEAMFVQLRAEEPEEDDSLWKVGVAFSGVAATIGSVLVVWGIAALLRARTDGPAAMIGGATLIVFGGLFVGVGMWMAVRSLRQRGVL